MLVDTQIYFENHHHQQHFYLENKTNEMFLVFRFSLCFLAPCETKLGPIFVAQVASFNSESNIQLVNLLNVGVEIHLA